jgi:hypothetical protein
MPHLFDAKVVLKYGEQTIRMYLNREQLHSRFKKGIEQISVCMLNTGKAQTIPKIQEM